MIAQSERDALRARIHAQTDYVAAARIYSAKTGRSIHHRYLYKFLSGERAVTGQKPGSHQPLQMWEAIVEAIGQREREAEKMTAEARALRARLAA